MAALKTSSLQLWLCLARLGADEYHVVLIVDKAEYEPAIASRLLDVLWIGRITIHTFTKCSQELGDLIKFIRTNKAWKSESKLLAILAHCNWLLT